MTIGQLTAGLPSLMTFRAFDLLQIIPQVFPPMEVPS